MKESSAIHFVKVGKGRMALHHRPRGTDFTLLREMGCTYTVTLLKESEGALRYGEMTRKAGIKWFWLAVPNGKYPEGEVHAALINAWPKLSQRLDDGNSILIHCSAGIHRTGTVAYGLLRWRGVAGEKAMHIIRQARKETAEGMLEKRMRWGDDNAREPVQQEPTWIHSVKEFAHRLQTSIFKKRWI
jgi:protein-tyrosine phosphatase